PLSMNSTQSKIKLYDANEEFELSVQTSLIPLTFGRDVYWWGPLWLPIFPTFLFTEKPPIKELPIEVRYRKKWTTDFKENDVELMHKRLDETNHASFSQPKNVVVRFTSESGKAKSIVLQGDANKLNDFESQFYRYTLSLNDAIPETFEVDVEIKSKIYTFTLRYQERWHFAIYAPFYCGLN
ncbi:MAG TPA: hypothetical protein VGE46_04210, partial [Bdellovibrio sp.]